MLGEIIPEWWPTSSGISTRFSDRLDIFAVAIVSNSLFV
jgi:hypothetical protein